MHSTYVTELTPPGRSAIAIVLVAGPEATRVVNACFKSARGREVADLPLYQIILGRWVGSVGEELLVCRRSPDRIEVHCHGGFAAATAIAQQLIDLGCCHISWQDWVRETGGDPIQASAQIAISDAPTARTAAILLDQYHGALSRAIADALAAISSADFPHSLEIMEAMLAYRDVGIHLTSPWRVVLAGRTNVGKSSLLNALAGFQRSIVSHEPGTTRDVVTLRTAIDGWPVQLADTAGMRDTDDELESAGVELAVTSLTNADLVLAVSDELTIENHSNDPVTGLLAGMPGKPRLIHVHNKVDLWAPTERTTAIRKAGSIGDLASGFLWLDSPRVLTSAVTGEGIGALVSAIGQVLVPVAPAAGSAVPFTAQHLAALDAALAAAEARDACAAGAALQSLLQLV
jgi:tRNA modification GTPase